MPSQASTVAFTSSCGEPEPAAVLGGLWLLTSFPHQADMGSHPTPRKGFVVMTEPRNGGVKTLGVKLPDALHAQFALVAQLDGISLGDAVLRAVEHYVQAKRAEGDFAERARQALEEIEREAAARRGAIEGLFGGSDIAASKPTGPRSRKASNES